jgi:hypothetical protein
VVLQVGATVQKGIEDEVPKWRDIVVKAGIKPV